jgi:hypothetical protein
MPNEFKQTVDLKEKMEKMEKDRRDKLLGNISQENKIDNKNKPAEKPVFKNNLVEAKKNAEEIDKVYRNNSSFFNKKDNFRKISRPKISYFNNLKIKPAYILIAIAIILIPAYLLIARGHQPKEAANPLEQKWYKVTLTNNDIFYGKIGDIKSDPVVINNVYYDYDQVNKETAGQKATASPAKDAGSIRLVKRGKETYGPDGSLNVVRSQVVYMEPLRDDSKVLQAILGNEKN